MLLFFPSPFQYVFHEDRESPSFHTQLFVWQILFYCIYLLIIIIFYPDLRIFFHCFEGEREREILMRERNISWLHSVSSLTRD